MNKERIAELRIEALNAKYAGKEFTIPAADTMEILNLAMNQLEPLVTPEMWKELGRIEHSFSTQDKVLTDDDLTQEFSLDTITRSLRHDDDDRVGFWEKELAEYIRVECNKALAAAAPSPAVAVEPTTDPRPLFDHKLKALEQRGYAVIGRILHKDGEYALFDSSCRWLTQPQYWRLMHEQDGSLFATPSPSLAVRDGVDAARYRWLRDSTDSGRCIRAMYEEGQKFPDNVDAAIDAAMREKP